MVKAIHDKKRPAVLKKQAEHERKRQIKSCRESLDLETRWLVENMDLLIQQRKYTSIWNLRKHMMLTNLLCESRKYILECMSFLQELETNKQFLESESHKRLEEYFCNKRRTEYNNRVLQIKYHRKRGRARHE